MRQAEVRVEFPAGLSTQDLDDGVRALAARGLRARRHPARRELAVTVEAEDKESAGARVAGVCEQVLGTVPRLRSVTFLSRGTDEDALGVIEAFGVRAGVQRLEEDGEEVAVFTLAAADQRRVPESRLHTALEAALNCEIRLRYV
ncbi:hypothetical protein HFP15_01615 [Amycolatopsis sp. K13G38]|uniref:Uncharacterized protein n=1 Tax=Amycolatopsis acididurans TaxID=2724524 RepID=A0ABX1IVR3_9PSEU|nr:hypothetical protein [Amycolatopsis acididurans]NKQ51573.1 hypothetical protein [Amycolatopsis acididurans]